MGYSAQVFVPNVTHGFLMNGEVMSWYARISLLKVLMQKRS